LAKRKRKKKNIGASLKYEVYGILLITVSVIALSGEAAVGRSLSNLFGLVLGKYYFVLALVGIYVGLAVMITRKWPAGWTTRKTGFLLFVLALTLWSAISDSDLKLRPAGPITSAGIIQQLSDIRSELSPGGIDNRSIIQKDISGGYAGTIQYALLFWLFGYFGAKFVLIVMIAISVMLMTGKSYVDMVRVLRQRGGRMFLLIRHKMEASRGSRGLHASASSSARNVQTDVPLLVLDDDDELADDYDDLPHAPADKRKKSLFFSWLQESAGSKKEKGANGSPASLTLDDDDDDYVSGSVLQHPDGWNDRKEDSGTGSPLSAVETPGSIDSASAPWEQADRELEVPPVWVDTLTSDTVLEPSGDSEISPVLKAEANNSAISGASEGTQAVKPATSSKASKPYRLPPLNLLSKPLNQGKSGPSDTSDSRRKLEATLESFGVKATVLDVVRGPAVTRYEVQPATGVKVSRIVSLTDDIALALAAKDIRMEAPIPGKAAIGIEVPNTEVSMVTMREVMETAAFQSAPSKLSIVFGRDISGQPIVGNLARMPHLLVAGATGSGKSVCINGIITSILYKAAPDEVKFLMVDPKMVELNMYNGIPHLLAPVVTDPRRASLALKKIVVEMEKRYEMFSKSGTRNIEGYNTLMAGNPAAVLPYIVVIVDELADLMMVAANDVEESITRLAQMARAAGIHLIIATQRPSVDVITGVIKANIPSRIAFGVSSQVDSRTILDMVGAEKLLGRGDMLFLPVGMSKPIRVQGAFLSDQEVEAVVAFARGQAEAEYKEDLVPEIEDVVPHEDDGLDELYDQAVQIVVEAKQASVSLLQRRMRVGYTRAARLVDQMEARGIVGPYEGSKPREVLLSLDQYQANKITS
jgi:S-DNA-T family DNA segregation ATPase FtsK/SpoIIIE